MIYKKTAVNLTIIVPSYNCAQYLPTTLDSILSQSVQPKEILVIDDATSDNSNQIVRSYQEKHKHIRLISNETNMGVIYTVNHGFKTATTKFVMSLAADDWILPDFIEKSMLLLEKYPQAGLCSTGSMIAIESQNNRLKLASMPKPSRHPCYINPTEACKLLTKLDSWFMGNSVIMNREMLLELGGYRNELKSFTDNFLYRLLSLKHGCCFIPESLSVWRIRSQSYSQTHCSNIIQTANILDIYNKFMTGKFSNLFPAKMVNREIKRWKFKLNRVLVNNSSNNIFSKLIYIGISCVLFAYYRPFDIWPFVVRKITPGTR